jgi:putative flavoprotein involved in K+ transport
MTLLGRVGAFENGVVQLAPDLASNIENGDKNYLSVLDKVDAYVTAKSLDFPEEPGARHIGRAPQCMNDPVLTLNLHEAGITSIIWATGYELDYSWLKLSAFDEKGRPVHDRGVSCIPGLYFLGLPWLSCRASPFIWGVWRDAEYLSHHIAARLA